MSDKTKAGNNKGKPQGNKASPATRGKFDNQNRGGRDQGRGGKGGKVNEQYANQPTFEPEEPEFNAVSKQLDDKYKLLKLQQAQIDSANQEKNDINAIINTIKEQLDKDQKTADKAAEERNILNNKLQQLKIELDPLRKELIELKKEAKIRDIKRTDDKEAKDIKKGDDKEVKDVKRGDDKEVKEEDIEEQIRQSLEKLEEEKRSLEEEVRSSASLAEQKRIISNVEKIGAKRKKIESILQKQQRFNVLSAQNKVIVENLKNARAVAQTAWEKKQETYAKFSEVRDKKTTDITPKIKDLITKKEEISKDIEGLKATKNEKYAALKVRRDEWRKEQEAKRKAAAEERTRLYEEKKKQLEEQGKGDEVAALEAATIKLPHIEEIKALEALLDYTKGLKINKKKPKTGFKHSLDILQIFGGFGLFPPQNGTQVESSVTALKEKIAAFEKLQKEHVEKETAKRAEEKAKRDAAPKADEEKKELPAGEASEQPKEVPVEQAKPAEPETKPAEEAQQKSE